MNWKVWRDSAVQQLRTLAALAEDLVSVPSSYVMAHNHLGPSSTVSGALICPPGAVGMHVVYIHI